MEGNSEEQTALQKLGAWWGEYRRTKQAAGVFVLLLNVVLIVASAQFTQYVFKDVDYYKPLFFTYFNATFMIILLFRPMVYKAVEAINKRNAARSGQAMKAQADHRNPESPSVGEDTAPDTVLCSLSIPFVGVLEAPTNAEIAQLFRHMRNTLWPLVVRLSLLWFVSNWVYSWSLALTSVSSNQILYQSTTLFAYVFSIWMLKERATWLKSTACLLCIGGVVLITWVDVDTSDEPIFQSSELAGDLLAVLGSVLFALYLTLFKKLYLDTQDSDFHCFVYFGIIGFVCALFAWPSLLVFHYTGWEVFEWPNTAELVGFMLVNAAVASILSNYFYALGVLWTSPLMANLVNSFTIPLAILSDSLLRNSSFPPLYLVGMALIFVSFLTVTVAEAREEARANAETETQQQQQGTAYVQLDGN